MSDVEGLECPKCGKHGFVRREHSDDDVFQCLYCNHTKNLTKSDKPPQPGGMGNFFLALVTFLLLSLIILGG